MRMTEKSFSSYSNYNDIFEDFLQKEPNSAFYTALDLVPDDILCKVCIAIQGFEYLSILFPFKGQVGIVCG